MVILKCKMCGGELVLTEGASVAECEYCGSVQTVPKADDEKKLTLFARANRLRVGCEFDKAAGVYETIVADFPEEAEAYWGLVLCRYGIEYVDDPATGKKIPTCHRAGFESVLKDKDFELAQEYADDMARRVYREEAKTIETIRKGIIEVSGKEEPYDIFICYKETGLDNKRTLDSVLAQDLYDALTDKGYRVFFSRITLEDKLGQEYEPYIFAALNSAKVMLVIGTCYEHYNAVWVKNEWSRYLKLMAADKSKHLIPCYKGIDAYDMPEEFARLQAQDLDKMGATQDILRGIEKLLPKQTAPVTVVQERVVLGGSGDNKIASLLDRGNMALEDGDWEKADSFFEDVLNNESKNAQAYLGKTLAQEQCRTMDAFVRKRKGIYANAQTKYLQLDEQARHIEEAVATYTLPEYLADDTIRGLYVFDLHYPTELESRQQQYRQEEAYWRDHKQLSKAEKFAEGAVAENLKREKQALFAALAEQVKMAEGAQTTAMEKQQAAYEAHIAEADEQVKKLYEEALERRGQDYEKHLIIAKSSESKYELKQAKAYFETNMDYRDSKALAGHCANRLGELTAVEAAAAARKQKELAEAQAKEIEHRQKLKAKLDAVAEHNEKRKKMMALLMAVLGVISTVFVALSMSGETPDEVVASIVGAVFVVIFSCVITVILSLLAFSAKKELSAKRLAVAARVFAVIGIVVWAVVAIAGLSEDLRMFGWGFSIMLIHLTAFIMLFYRKKLSDTDPEIMAVMETVSAEDDGKRSPKNKTIALVLCVLLGTLGIHRFYVGKVKTGAVWLLTGGCCYIGWFIDIYKIAAGKFTDKDGNVLTT